MFSEIYERDFENCIRAPEASLLHLHWRVARGARALPEEGDIPEHRIAYLKPDLMILRPDGPHDWVYEHYGCNISLQTGFDMTGRRVSDFKGALKDLFVAVYGRAARERRPFGTVHRFGRFGETPLWERLILPFGDSTRVTCLLVVNKVREIANDISLLTARAKDRGLLVLQFERDHEGSIVDARIIGANLKSAITTRRRIDELVGSSILALFPGLREAGLWDRYLAVAALRAPETAEVPYDADGVKGTFRVEISPLLDGVTITFEVIEARAQVARAPGKVA
jgi:hypothetical protein